jgi:glycosyltransferase involved in cell wall biosynthesis
VQNKKFYDIEIIFIDDYSENNSVKVIEKYQKQDERIILIFYAVFIFF